MSEPALLELLPPPGRLTHITLDRTSFMPGVLLACRKVGTLTESPVVGLEHLL